MVSKTYQNDGKEGRPTTIAASAEWVIDPAARAGVDQDYMSRSHPYNSLFVRNRDSNTIRILPNGSFARLIELPQGATVTVMDEPFSYLRIVNIGSGIIAQGNLTIKIEKLVKK